MQSADTRATGFTQGRGHWLPDVVRSGRSPKRRAMPAAGACLVVVLAITHTGTDSAVAALARPTPPAEVVEAIAAVFPPGQHANALAIAYCESNWLTNTRTAGSRRAVVGLFQISRVHRKRLEASGYTWDQVRLDPMVNAQVAALLWRNEGWRPWSCKRVLPRAERRVLPTSDELSWHRLPAVVASESPDP